MLHPLIRGSCGLSITGSQHNWSQSKKSLKYRTAIAFACMAPVPPSTSIPPLALDPPSYSSSSSPYACNPISAVRACVRGR